MANKEPLVSVVVPVYKVEEYLADCVNSLVNQTHRNMEIILVDDGSPDRCPQLCDEWAARDPRIKVVHKKNGGLSSARSAGMDVATGDYIAFVDSDDWVALNMYERLLKGFDEHSDVGVVSCSVMKVQDGVESPFEPAWSLSKPLYHNPEEFVESKIKETSCHAVWNKLIRADLVTDVRFRNGLLGEDTFFSYDLYKVLRKVRLGELILPDYLLYYRMRTNSLCHTAHETIRFHVVRALRTLVGDSKVDCPQYTDMIYKAYVMKLYVLLDEIMHDKVMADMYFDKYVAELREVSPLWIIRNIPWKEGMKYFLDMRLFPYRMRKRIYGY